MRRPIKFRTRLQVFLSSLPPPPPPRERWWLCETLVIDEISMLDSSLFEMLSQIAQEVKQNNRPFGGIQLILSGDFYQLPPVKGRFAFTSPLWAQAELRSFVLKEVLRQRGDSKFVLLLNKFRTGQIGSLELDDINECHEDVFKGFPNDGILPTKLYCKNRDVDAENRWEMGGEGGRRRPAHCHVGGPPPSCPKSYPQPYKSKRLSHPPP
jgi:ATP-dependent DNA helicase PIF1